MSQQTHERRALDESAAVAQPPCEAAPLPPQYESSKLGEVHDEDGTTYLIHVGDEGSSECSESDFGDSSVAHELSDEGDDGHAYEVHMKPAAAADRYTLSASPVGPSTAHSSPVRVRRHNVYALRVMPAAAYAYIVPPPVVIDDDQPATEVAPGDVADEADLAPEAGPSYHADDAYYHDAAYPEEYGYASEAPAAPEQQPAAAAAPRGTVMCCYYKQGHCSMGDDCWYAHEGTESTPCHYGASCRKGHRHLVRSNADAAPVNRKDGGNAARGSKKGAQRKEAASAVPKRYVHEPKPVRPSAPVVDAPEIECPRCGTVGRVRTQQFPVFEGDRPRQAMRGACGECHQIFMLQ